MTLDEKTKKYIAEHINDDIRRLALKKFPEGVEKQMVLRQVEARQVLAKKVPSWAENDSLVFGGRLPLEQCSSEQAAKYKSKIISKYVESQRFADLTGGLGIDAFFLSENFKESYYVEKQKELCDAAEHNFKALGSDIKVENTDSLSFILKNDGFDLIYIDPARRDGLGRKMVSLHDCSPDVVEFQDVLLQKSEFVMVKLSPMLDLNVALGELKNVREIHVVALKNECKEVVAVMQRGYSEEVAIHCVDLKNDSVDFCFKKNEEADCLLVLADEVGKYLYEPNVSLLKAGAFKLAARRYSVSKLHKNSHLYTSDILIPDFFGRVFEVLAVESFGKKLKKTMLKDIPKANVAVRNFPLTADELRKLFRLSDGGDFYIFGTTIKGDEKVVILTVSVR